MTLPARGQLVWSSFLQQEALPFLHACLTVFYDDVIRKIEVPYCSA